MRTDELINTLVADHAVQPRPKPVGHGLVMAIIGGLAISGALFALTLGVRPDIVSALGTWRFDLKLSANLVLVIAATWVSLRLSSPTRTARPSCWDGVLSGPQGGVWQIISEQRSRHASCAASIA